MKTAATAGGQPRLRLADPKSGITLMGLLVRTLACFLLVFATWNPTGHSYFGWLWSDEGTAPAKAAAGSLLLAGHLLFLRTAWLSLGVAGGLAGVAVLVTGVLTLSKFGVIDFSRDGAHSYAVLSVFALLMAGGVSWSHIKRRLVGQSNYLTQPP